MNNEEYWEEQYKSLQKYTREIEKENVKFRTEINKLKNESLGLKEQINKLTYENSESGINELKQKIVEQQELIEKLNSKITLQSKARQISDEDVKKIKQLRADGLTYRKIEEQTKWSRFTISRVLNGVYD